MVLHTAKGAMQLPIDRSPLPFHLLCALVFFLSKSVAGKSGLELLILLALEINCCAPQQPVPHFWVLKYCSVCVCWGVGAAFHMC